MDGLDRLGWAAGMSIVSYGVRVGIRINRAEALDRVAGLLPPGWRHASSPRVRRLYSVILGDSEKNAQGHRRISLLYGDTMRMLRSREPEEVLERLESDLRLYVAEGARRRVFVHAGVVGWRGRAIVIPGSSYSGKTSLVAALLRAGASYYSDEYAVLDERGRVHPFPSLLSVREEPGSSATRYPPEALDGRSGSDPLPLGLVAVTEYRSGARWRPRPLSPGQATLAMLAHTVPARRRPEYALATLRRAVAGAVVLKSARGEASRVVEAFLEVVG